MEDAYINFFLNSKASVVKYETFELSHPNFDASFYVVRNNANGITAKLETGESKFFEYFPVEIKQNSNENNLDFSIQIVFGDLGELVPDQLDRIQAAENYNTKPEFIFREYRSDDLERPMNGPFRLEVTTMQFDSEGASFEAKAVQLNLHKTGEIYTIDRFPMLRSLV